MVKGHQKKHWYLHGEHFQSQHLQKIIASILDANPNRTRLSLSVSEFFFERVSSGQANY